MLTPRAGPGRSGPGRVLAQKSGPAGRAGPGLAGPAQAQISRAGPGPGPDFWARFPILIATLSSFSIFKSKHFIICY